MMSAISNQIYTCRNFVFCYKDESYESQWAHYNGALLEEIKHCFSLGAKEVNESTKKKIARDRRKSEAGFVSSIRRRISTDPSMVDSGRGGLISSIRRKISTDPALSKQHHPDDNKRAFTPSSSRKMSTPFPLVKQNLDMSNMITEKDVELLSVSLKQKGDTVTVTILNEIDARWFRKSTKLFFQAFCLQNGII